MDQSQHTLLHVEGEAKLLILLSLTVTETNSGTNKYFLAILIPRATIVQLVYIYYPWLNIICFPYFHDHLHAIT